MLVLSLHDRELAVSHTVLLGYHAAWNSRSFCLSARESANKSAGEEHTLEGFRFWAVADDPYALGRGLFV